MRGMARTPEQRGSFGRWLVAERKARGWTADDMRARLQDARGFAMAHSTYALLESGQRQPTEEQRRHLTEFLGSVPEPESQNAAPSSDLAALVSAQQDLIREMREDRKALLAQNDLLRQLLDRLLPAASEQPTSSESRSPDHSVAGSERPEAPRITDSMVMMVAGLVIAVAVVAIAIKLWA